jgi:hypothetical protein
MAVLQGTGWIRQLFICIVDEEDKIAQNKSANNQACPEITGEVFEDPLITM